MTSPCFLFSPSALLRTPSRADDITMEEEQWLRRAGASYILEMAKRHYPEEM